MTDKSPFDDLFPDAAGNPMKAAQQNMRASRPKRFYKTVGLEEKDGAFALTLDGRVARTPSREPLVLPTRAAGEAIAAEWEAQKDEIDPMAMPLTRLVNAAIDGVRGREQAVIDDLVKYAGSDLLCYRAGEPERLVALQSNHWDPVLEWADEALGARFILAQGVMFAAQPDTAVAAIRRAVEAHASCYTLAALHSMTTLSGSVLLALAVADGRLGVEEAWAAAHVDEDFQISVWGTDDEALERRAARKREFDAAARLFSACASA